MKQCKLKASEVLRQAAKRVEKKLNVYGCSAISEAADRIAGVDYTTIQLARKYYINFRPNSKPIVWFPCDDQGQRILALCFAAAIAESEGN